MFAFVKCEFLELAFTKCELSLIFPIIEIQKKKEKEVEDLAFNKCEVRSVEAMPKRVMKLEPIFFTIYYLKIISKNMNLDTRILCNNDDTATATMIILQFEQKIKLNEVFTSLNN